MQSNYWSNVLSRRTSRRRALAAVGGTAAAAAFLAACGGDDSGGGGESSGLVSKPVDTSKEAKRGGTSKWFLTAEPAGFDLHVGGAPKNNPKNLAVSNLVSAKPGYLTEPDFSDYIPDIAQSWEWAPDGLSITFKIQPNAKWHNKPPINGRAFDMDDLMFSWSRFTTKGRDRGAVVNAANPDAPVLSFTATDRSTAVMKLKEPTVFLLALFAPTTVGKMVILPKETDSTFQLESDLIGTGPYVLTNYQPSVGMTFKKFPDYYEKDFAFVDTIEAPFIIEYAQMLAQFRAGNIYSLGADMRQEDVLQTKKDLPELIVSANAPVGFSGAALNFGYLPGSVFHDERVRQAFSMSFDRDLVIDVLYNAETFRKEGLPVQSYWATSLSAGAGSWRLDPKSKDFGPNSKYFQYLPDESKKLLAAAGYPNGLEIVSSYIPGPQLGDDYLRENQILEDMVRNIGVRPKTNLIDYVTEYPNYRDKGGQYEGYSYIAGPTTADDATGMLVWRYSKAGGAGYLAFDAAGKGDRSGDPQVDSLLKKAQTELDIDKRKGILFDLQRYLAQKQYNVTKPGGADTFQMAWPVLGNFNVYRRDRRTPNYHWWIDDTKPPLKRA
jgi:peptide/nickel transport system substrate-binding protein